MTDFAYQLYSSRNFPPLAKTLTMLADLGYRQVEGYSTLYANPDMVAELNEHLGASGLTMPSGHFSIGMLEDEPEAVIEIARKVGIKTLFCPAIGPDERPDSGPGWEAFGRRLSEAAKPYRDAGLSFGWHNHDFELAVQADGAIPLAAIFEGGPDLDWEADIAWIVRGGADPMAWIASHGERITAVHIKDMAPQGEALDEDGWADVGVGTMDWQGLMDAVRTTPCQYFVMEHDNPSDDARFARRSLASARTY